MKTIERCSTYANCSYEDLNRAWKKIEPQGNWRDPIIAWINREDYEDCVKACEFFTATKLKPELKLTRLIEEYEEENKMLVDNRLLVTSEGYRNGPAGP